MSERLHQLLDRGLDLPVLRDWRRRRFVRDFSAGHYAGMFCGVYPTHAAAASAAPSSRPLGYDHAAPAGMYDDRLDRVYPADYPAMLWLDRAFTAGVRSVFDLGGHRGIAYYAYIRYLHYPEGLRWQVCDVPAVVEAGRALARSRDAAQRLSFTERFADGDGFDLLFTSGCLQYLEPTVAAILGGHLRPPRWLIVNLLPRHPQREYWTVQNIGTAFCPYRIQRDADFFAALERLGYRLRDRWVNAERRCRIAFEPMLSLDHYVGAAFELDSTART